MSEGFGTGTGMLLGKFLPPHLGHVYLAQLARQYVRSLSIVVCSLEREPIPGVLRHRWMRELFPDAHVLHLTDELPQEPSEHPDFWRLWRESLTRILPERPDFVFASEHYGAPLAEVLGARFIPVDVGRAAVPVSGTAIRTDPMKHWAFLPVPVRPYFVRRVCVFGPESTGKTTLARALAEALGTAWVPEYARVHLEAQGGRIEEADIERIARGQVASEEALARQAQRVLVCDTDLLSTTLWSDALFGSCPEWIRAEAERRLCDLYLLNDVDVPFVADPVRYLPQGRRAFFERCREALESRGLPYVVLSGSWDERRQRAIEAVRRLIAAPRVR